jgi:uncharacterized protein (DUF885 family)
VIDTIIDGGQRTRPGDTPTTHPKGVPGMKTTLLALVFAFLVAGLPATTAAAPDAGSSADQQLRALYNAEFAWRQAQLGRIQDQDGRWAKPGPHLPKVDAATQAARLAYWNKALAQLDTIPVAQLSPAEKINAAVFRQSIQTLANEVRFKAYEQPFNSDTFFWGQLQPGFGGFANAEEYRNYISRLREIPRYFAEQTVNMQAGLARGFSVPRVTLTGRDDTIVPYTRTTQDNPLYGPLKAMPASIPAAEQAQLQAEAKQVIDGVAVPAYSKLLAFIRNVYMKQARTTLAAETMPDGKAYYQAQIQAYTTTDLTAEQIHAKGLKEVARISAEMESVKAKTDFTGSMPEFLHFLRTDPRFYPKTPAELLGYSAYVIKRVDGQIGRFIGFLPRARFTLRPVPPEIAPIYTSGRGGQGSCLMNTYNLPARPLYQNTALTLHECTPGHAFQGLVARELGADLPPFRAATYFSGFGEGWGLYMEWLGTKMGLYDTPYEDFGRLSFEIWRASRLVIDTGLHHYGWTRGQAQKYLHDHTALAEHDIATEVDRYISWPGQALAYKLGEMLVRRERAKAEQVLGDKFDERAFHNTILATGSVPLPVLEAQLEAYIASGGKDPIEPRTGATIHYFQ